MNEEKFYIVGEEIIPEVFKKVIEVKENILTGKAKDISEAVKIVGISRSTFYKYRDHVFIMSEGINSKKINQDIPINMAANVTITLDISHIKKDLKHLVNTLRGLPNVISVKVLAME